MKMLDVVVDSGGLERLLPRLREITQAVLATHRVVLRMDAQLAYKPRIDEHPERITIEVHSPFAATIVGKWVAAGHVLFQIIDWPFVTVPTVTEQLVLNAPAQEEGRAYRNISVDD